MALSAFDDKSRPPEAAELKGVLGKLAGLWDQLVSHVAREHPPITELLGGGAALACAERRSLEVWPRIHYRGNVTPCDWLNPS